MNTLREAAMNAGKVTVEAVKAAIAKIHEILKAIGESISKATGVARDKLVELKVGLEMGLKDMVNGLGDAYKEAKAFVSTKVEQGTNGVNSVIEAKKALSLKNRIVGYREMVTTTKGNPSNIDNIKNLIANLTEAKDAPEVLKTLEMTKRQVIGEINKLNNQLNRIEKSLLPKTQSVPASISKPVAA